MDIGQYLTKARKRKGLSQEEVANELNVSRQSVSLWECDQTVPSLDNLIAISKLYGTSVDVLTGQADFPGEVLLNNDGSIVDEKAREEEIYKSYKRFLLLSIIFSAVSAITFWIPVLATMTTTATIVFSILSMRRRKDNKNLLTLVIGITLFITSIFIYINFPTLTRLFEEVFI
jgi:transcriptional regulator with XRE-family HTH domain